jgi:hypothetical protein
MSGLVILKLCTLYWFAENNLTPNTKYENPSSATGTDPWDMPSVLKKFPTLTIDGNIM